MKPVYQCNIALTALLILALSGPFSQAAPVSSQTTFDASAGYISYLSRPNALELTPRAHPDLGVEWEQIKKAHIESVAMFLEMYPDQDIYFLARDSELLYDLAKWTTRNEPSLSERLHLLNISRENMRDSNVRNYLAQEGISEAALKAGKRFLFVDTGFAGTIPQVIKDYFPEQYRSQLKSHLITSSNLSYPSSRVFLSTLDPAAALAHPMEMHNALKKYEHLPRYTYRSSRFAQDGGKWVPLSLNYGKADGSVDQGLAVKYMEDLLFEAEKEDSRKLMRDRRALWQTFKKLADTGDESKIAHELKTFVQTHPNSRLAEALVRDFVEMASTRTITSPRPFYIRLQDIGLKPELREKVDPNAGYLIKNFPQWAPIIENPHIEIGEAIRRGEFSKLEDLLSMIRDREFVRIFGYTFQMAQRDLRDPHLIKRSDAFIIELAKKQDPELNRTIVESVYLPGAWAEKKELVQLLLKTADQQVKLQLVPKVFSYPNAPPLKELIAPLIKEGDPLIVKKFAEIWGWQWIDNPEQDDIIRLLVENGDKDTLLELRTALTKKKTPLSPAQKVLLQSLDKADTHSRITFSDNHLEEPRLTSDPKYKIISHSQLPISKPPAAEPVVAKTLSQETLPPIKPITANLQPGSSIRTKEGLDLTVIKYVDRGKRGVIYQVKDAKGTLFALKVAKDSLPETLESFSKETKKAERYKKYGVKHSRIIEAQADYVLKEWIEGTRADEWLNTWIAEGRPEEVMPIKKLRQLVQSTSSAGAYVGDLNPKNLIWNGNDWVVIDSGSVRQDLAPEDALSRYLENIPRRWAKSAQMSGCASAVQQAIERILQQP